MAELIPSFARKREVANHAVYTEALAAIGKFVQALPEEGRERFFCLVADVARSLAWAAGRRDWVSLLERMTRDGQEEYAVVVRKMGLAESLETALWAAMRAHPQPLFRHALGLVAVRIHLGIAWADRKVLQVRDAAGAMILDAFDAAEISPTQAADLQDEDFRVGGAAEEAQIFSILRETAFSRGMSGDGPFSEPGACNAALRDAFGLDFLPGAKVDSPCFDMVLRNVNETGVKGAYAAAAKVFSAEDAEGALARLGFSLADVKAHVSVPETLAIAADLWGCRLEARTAPELGAARAAELRRRCHAAFAYGRAATPAFLLLAMLAEGRWLVLAGEGADGPAKAISRMLEEGGSWPSIVPPEGVSVRAADREAEPKVAELMERNRWNGRQFKWYWVAVVLAVMVYGWAVSVGLL
ncbi:hypothetical protein [Oleispirillum naphthae]|uniref:hypothetical protein n=1 Tax=Oleispirillum naphthae TaxID=2838853 RepID=UPI0030824693